MTATSSRMSPGKWVLVGFCGILVVLLAVFAQPDPFGSAAPAPSQAAPQESADADAALAEQQRRVREFFVNDLPRRQADDPLAMGAVDAPVVLTEWADYRCPFCSVWAEQTLPELQPYIDAGTLRVEFRDLAIFGDESMKAATAARAAGEQGAYFEFAHALFVALPDQGHPDIPDDLVYGIVAELGLDAEQFATDWADPKHRDAVLLDSQEAQQLGVTSTPSFIIGGQFLAGAQPLETFAQVIEQQAALLG